MAGITPNEGLEFTGDMLLGDSSTDGWELYQVAVGEGSSNLNENDTQLDTEVYRADNDDSNISIEDSSTDGLLIIRVTISGGTEVDAGTTVTEFGIFACDPSNAPADDSVDANDILLHRELRDGVTLTSGDRKTFEIPYEIDSR